jgi:asparagine synthase (glutamine-hydrolysing)
MKTLGEMLSYRDGCEFYLRLNTHWRDSSAVVIDPGATSCELERLALNLPLPLIEQMMLLDTVSYLPDDILVKVDRASMAVGLEARVPLLDHRLVEFAWTLPLEWKFREGRGKWILRRLLERYVPRELFERPKVGFGVPIDSWLRGPLRDWAEALLDERRLRAEGFFHPEPIRRTWQAHLEGPQDWHYLLWDVLMFQAWREAAEA